MDFNFRRSSYSLPNGAEYSQFACLTLSLDHSAVIQPKRRAMTKTRKRHKIISLQFLHSIGLGLSGRFPSLLRWRRKTLWEERWSRLKKIYYLWVCIYMNLYTHTYMSIISGWSGVSFTFWSGENQPQKILQNKKTMFPAARKQLPPAVPTAEVKCLLYFPLYLMWMVLHTLRRQQPQQ